jgi:hypothetical protein
VAGAQVIFWIHQGFSQSQNDYFYGEKCHTNNSVSQNEMSQNETYLDVMDVSKYIVSKYSVFCLEKCHIYTRYLIDKAVSVPKYVVMSRDVMSQKAVS